MAAASLNFNEATLDKTSALYNLYIKLYSGMNAANQVDAPDYVTSPPLKADGSVDTDAINKSVSEYTTILMKNSAYMMADSIVGTIGDGNANEPEGGYLPIQGGSMAGGLNALFGFSAGVLGTKYFEVFKTDSSNGINVTGVANISGALSVGGRIYASNDGIYINNAQAIYKTDTGIGVKGAIITLDGAVKISGNISTSKVSINSNGIYYGESVYYHSGNSNLSTVDWTMRQAVVAGNLAVSGTATISNKLSALAGFNIGVGSQSLLQSVTETSKPSYIQLNTYMNVVSGGGIQFNGARIINPILGSENSVSFAAPGMIMYLGDTDGRTSKISLQSDIYDTTKTNKLISKYGDGLFPNSLQAGCGNGSSIVLSTYSSSTADKGVAISGNLRLGDKTGPYISTNDTKNAVIVSIPYSHTETGSATINYIPFSATYAQTTSLFKDQSKAWSASLKLNTDAEFFTFAKPIESSSISIISSVYKTRLIENALFLNDGIFLEGVTGGIRHSGNSFFDGDLSSRTFSSGFAGSGWGIIKNQLTGNVGATFDNITVRKKFKAYEFEVQKLSVNNGSLWISDACSGDEVEEIA